VQCFIAFSSDDEIPLLEKTLEAWAQADNCVPSILQTTPEKHELQRRVMADNIAEGKFYLLADLATAPSCRELIGLIQARLNKTSDNVALIGLSPGWVTELPTGVRICRKGAVEKWPQKQTPTYDHEHVQAVTLAGKRWHLWNDLYYRNILAC
jgi:hypothetical protein